MIEMQPLRRQLFRIAAGDQIEQRAPVGQAIQRCRLARRQRRGDDARPQRDQKFQPLGDRDQRGGHQPGVFARAAGGDQYAAESQPIRRLGDLLQVTVIDAARPLCAAEIVAVAVGG